MRQCLPDRGYMQIFGLRGPRNPENYYFGNGRPDCHYGGLRRQIHVYCVTGKDNK